MKILKKIFEPNKLIGLILFNLGVILLIYTFTNHLENTWISYIAYILSTYALIIFLIWFYKASKNFNYYIKQSKTYRIYNNNIKTFTKLTMIFSFSINLLLGLIKLILGIYYKSEWFITFAVYYIILSLMKLSLILSIRKEDFGTNLQKEYEKLKHTGIILLLLDLILFGIIILIIKQNQIISYPGHLIYLVAMYDFYLIISAFINVIKYRKNNSPILTSSKCINLTVAMISIISLEIAMIYKFGSNDNDFKLIMTSITGLGVCLINSLMSLYMIIKSKK